LGAYSEMAKANISGSSLDPDLTSYGLSVGKDFDTWNIEGFIGASDSHLFSLIASNVDVMDIGVRGSYRGVENLTMGGHFIYSEVDIPAAST
jgi:hypothetical protein